MSEDVAAVGVGSKDGTGAGDNDQPYKFGRKPRAIALYPFSERQFIRLLLLRGRIQDRPIGADDHTKGSAA